VSETRILVRSPSLPGSGCGEDPYPMTGNKDRDGKIFRTNGDGLERHSPIGKFFVAIFRHSLSVWAGLGCFFYQDP
jgi:hypothetical protein